MLVKSFNKTHDEFVRMKLLKGIERLVQGTILCEEELESKVFYKDKNLNCTKEVMRNKFYKAQIIIS